MSFGKNLTFDSAVFGLTRLQHRDISQLAAAADHRYLSGMRVGVDAFDRMVSVEYENGTKVTRTLNADGVITVIVSKDGGYWINSSNGIWAAID